MKQRIARYQYEIVHSFQTESMRLSTPSLVYKCSRETPGEPSMNFQGSSAVYTATSIGANSKYLAQASTETQAYDASPQHHTPYLTQHHAPYLARGDTPGTSCALLSRCLRDRRHNERLHACPYVHLTSVTVVQQSTTARASQNVHASPDLCRVYGHHVGKSIDLNVPSTD